MLLREGHRHAASVPPTVQAVVAARLDALPAPARDVARRSSVFLSSFDRDQVAALASAESAIDASPRGARGSRAAGARRRRGPRWRFRHQTLRDVAYASLPKRQRRELHLAVADRLTADGHRSWAAEHLEQAALAALDLEPASRELPDRAADALAEAGDRARRRMENRSALARYRRALALAGDGDRWGCARRGCSRAWARPSTGSASTRGDRGPRAGRRARYAPRRRLDARARLRFLGDIRINGRRRRQRGVTARSFLGRRTARRAGSDRAHAAVRRLGALDPQAAGGRRGDLAAVARDRRGDRRPLQHARPLCSLSIASPTRTGSTKRPR